MLILKIFGLPIGHAKDCKSERTDDNIVNLCEMKFLKDKFTINKSYDEKLRSRTQMLIDRLPKRATVHLTLITSYGLKYNEYSGEIQKLLTLDSLFTE